MTKAAAGDLSLSKCRISAEGRMLAKRPEMEVKVNSIKIEVLAGLALIVAVAFPAAGAEPVTGDDRIARANGDVIVHLFHHASMMLTWNGTNILIDPTPAFGAEGDATAEYKAMPAPSLILVTHEHPDHFNADILAVVAGDATIVVPQAV